MSPELTETKPASLFKRLIAIFYDLFLLLALLFIVGVVAAGILTFAINNGNAITADHPYYLPYRTFILLLLFFTGLGFFGWFWTHGGQTLGMRTWRLKLVSDNDQTISWQQALIRYSGAILSWGCAGLGFLWALFNKKKKTWHDLLSKTAVIQLNKPDKK